MKPTAHRAAPLPPFPEKLAGATRELADGLARAVARFLPQITSCTCDECVRAKPGLRPLAALREALGAYLLTK